MRITVGRGHDPADQLLMFEFYKRRAEERHVILSERSESKDLRIDDTFQGEKVRRSLDFM